MRNIFAALIFFISISLFSQEEKRLALVIGNANYDKGELKNPRINDTLITSHWKGNIVFFSSGFIYDSSGCVK